MNLTDKDRQNIVDVAVSFLGRPYKLGAKWDIYGIQDPKGPIDCSGFVRYCYWRGASKLIRDGSMQQFEDTEETDGPKIGDVAFFRGQTSGLIHHVGMIADDKQMIEARGEPYNKVIYRPRSKWENWEEFTGYRKFK